MSMSQTIHWKSQIPASRGDGEQKVESDDHQLEQIRLCAYLKWKAAGEPICDGVEFWHQAEQELLGERRAI